MPTKEEIREGIAEIIGENIGTVCSEFGGDPTKETQLEVTKILSYLHSQGVVVKVPVAPPIGGSARMCCYEELVDD